MPLCEWRLYWVTSPEVFTWELQQDRGTHLATCQQQAQASSQRPFCPCLVSCASLAVVVALPLQVLRPPVHALHLRAPYIRFSGCKVV